MRSIFKWGGVLVLFFVAMVWFWGGCFLCSIGSYLVVSDPLAKADAIIVLGGDVGERVYYAVELYKKDYAPKIVMSGGPLAWRMSLADNMKDEAIFYGALAKDIILENRAQSTLDNAKFILPIIGKYKFKKLIVVTSPYHARRAKKVFDKLYKNHKIEIIISPAIKNIYTRFDLRNWWIDYETQQLVFSEYLKLFSYWLKGYI